MSILERLLPPVLAQRLKGSGPKKTAPAKPAKAPKAPKAVKAAKVPAPKKAVPGPSPWDGLKRLFLPPALANGKTVASKKAPAKAAPAKVASKAPKAAPVPVAPPATFTGARLASVIFSLILAGLAQWQFMTRDSGDTLVRGCILALAAVALLVWTLAPWKGEDTSSDTIDPWVERVAVGVILLVALFFRTFRLDQMPPGIFIDQGICGNIALQILKEGARPIFADNILRNPPYLMYQLAVWFMFFKATAANFLLFFGLMSVGLVFFAYWTFRQIAGVRAALVAAYILAVMCWNVNFSRNGFPTIEVAFYMFATMAFLYHGLNTRKRWAFVVSALFFSGGMYTYQAYKIFPALLALFGVYEWFANRERLKANARHLVLFSVMFVVLIQPFLYITFHNGNNIWREQNYNIFSQIKEERSYKPALDMVTRTAKMFNREGDSNERHNYPNQRMLDDITGALFVLGLFFSLTRVRKRPYFFATVGFGVMCLPCLLSQDPAHANRMLGTTPFIAILAALPLAAVWDRVRSRWGRVGDLVFALILLEPLFLMGVQNYQFYFVKQAHNNGLWTTGVWAGYSVPETRIGQTIAREGKKYDYFITPRFFQYPTIDFLAFDYKSQLKRLTMPDDMAPIHAEGTRGAMFILMKEHDALVQALQELYPKGVLTLEKDLQGNVIAQYFAVEAEDLRAARGLSGTVDGKEAHWSDFPRGLPSGSHRFSVKGYVFVDKADRYQVRARVSNARVRIAGTTILPGMNLPLAKGFYPLEADWTSGSDDPNPGLKLISSQNVEIPLNPTNVASTAPARGLKGRFYRALSDTEKGPEVVQWNPVLNFPHGGDFNFPFDPMFVSWDGVLKAPQSGQYTFTTRTEEFAQLTIDGKKVFDWAKAPTGSVNLAAGPHSFTLKFRKQLGPILSLNWKTPDGRISAVPMSAFGETKPGL